MCVFLFVCVIMCLWFCMSLYTCIKKVRGPTSTKFTNIRFELVTVKKIAVQRSTSGLIYGLTMSIKHCTKLKKLNHEKNELRLLTLFVFGGLLFLLLCVLMCMLMCVLFNVLLCMSLCMYCVYLRECICVCICVFGCVFVCVFCVYLSVYLCVFLCVCVIL